MVARGEGIPRFLPHSQQEGPMLDNLLGQDVEWVQALAALAMVSVIAYAVA